MMHMDAWIAYQRAHGVRGDGRPAAEASIALLIMKGLTAAVGQTTH
jgi:hypothetical protein